MQLLNLRIFNIGSLVGAHHIDFRKIAQLSGGLYAFSGATGSGKSTLLSCLTLALYAKPLRPELKPQDLISVHENSCEVSLEILLKGECYLFCFSAMIVKGKTYYDHYVMQNEKRLSQTPAQVLPLSLKHFCQTAILPQGEFSKYLLGTFSERKLILSKFIQEEELDRFSLFLKSRFDDYQTRELKLNARLEFLGQENEKNDWAKLKEEEATNKLIISRIRPLLIGLKKLQVLCRDLQKILINYEQLKQRQKKIQEELSPLAAELSSLLERNIVSADPKTSSHDNLLLTQFHKMRLKLKELAPILKNIKRFTNESAFSIDLEKKLNEVEIILASKVEDRDTQPIDDKYQEEIDLHRLIELEKSIHFMKNQQGILRDTEESIWRNFYQTLADIKGLELAPIPPEFLSDEISSNLTQTLEALVKLNQIQDIESHLSLQTILSLLQERTISSLTSYLEEKVQRAQHDLLKLGPLLQQNEEKETERSAVKNNLAELALVSSQIEILHRHCSRDEFKNFWLYKIEEDLLYFANIELDKIYDGRYQILLKKQPQGHALFLKDSKYPDRERKVSTLSGGESFLISLCLSLALSALSKKDQICDFFFIDEGFGSLDIDSLDQAMEILCQFVTQGKSVGLISHVTELTERIPIRIHLKKDSMGQSRMKIIGEETLSSAKNLHS